MRRELRRVFPGVKVSTEEIAEIIREDVLKRDVVEGQAAEESQRRVKRAPKKKLRRTTPAPAE